jgi:MFS family permease
MKKQMWLIYIVAFMCVAGYTAALPIMPAFVQARGGQVSEIGLVLGLVALISVISGPIVGYYGDRLGRRPVLIASMIGFGVWYGLFFLARNMTLVYVGAFIGGIFAAGALSVATAYASDAAGPEKTGGAIAKMQAAQMVGALLPPLAAGYLAEVNISLPFGILSAIALTTAVLMIFLLGESMPVEAIAEGRKSQMSPITATGKSFAKIFAYLKTPVGPLLLIALMIAFPTGFFQATLPLLTGNTGLSTGDTGLIFSVGTLSIVLVNILIVEWLMKKVGYWANILAGLVAAAIFYLILPFCASFWAFMITNLLLSITTSSMRPAQITLIASQVEATEQSIAQSAYNQWTAIGNIFGPPLGTALYSAIGGVATYAVAAVLFFIGAGYTFNASRRVSQPVVEKVSEAVSSR